MKVIKYDNHQWMIEGTTSGWIHGEKFDTKWKAETALDVFNRGGDQREYLREAKKLRKKRNEKRQRSLENELSRGDKSYYEFGYELATKNKLGSTDPSNWGEVGPPFWSSTEFFRVRKAREMLNIAISLGIGDSLKEAKARYLIIRIDADYLYSQIGSLYKFTERYPHVRALASDIVNYTIKHLRHSPHNLEALYLQKAAYKLLKDSRGVSRAELGIQQALSLIQAGLLAKSGDEKPQARKKVAIKSPGLQLEETALILIQAMGLSAETTKASGDGGIDIVAFSKSPIISGKYIVQCKDWTTPIGEPIIRDLFGVVISEGANKGILITTGRFTAAAEKFAEGKQLELIDGEKLGQLLKQHHIT